MNTSAPPIPPPVGAVPVQLPPLGQLPEDTEPIPNLFAAVEAVLRQPRRIFYHLRQSSAGRIILILFCVSLLSSLIYGVVAGSFSMGDQLWIAPVKIAGGFLFAALICLPSLYIFACLSGSKARLVEIIGLLAGLLALTTILLIGFA